jgi:hypothetical protein
MARSSRFVLCDQHTLTGATIALLAACSAAGSTPIALTASDASAGANFGSGIAIDGDTMIIGADRDDEAATNAGAAYVFRWTGAGWAQETKLMVNDGALEDHFGLRVALDDDTAIIGARFDDDAGTSSGSAYVFVRVGGVWTQQAKLTALDASAGDFFGMSVSIDGDTAVVGAWSDDDAGTDSGSAYVFTRSGTTWTQQAKFVAADGAAGDRFGVSVAVDGDTIAVGAYADDTAQGSVYMFRRTGGVWANESKLTASGATSGDQFGLSVALRGDRLAVGANLVDGSAGADQGAAYVFAWNGSTWSEEAKVFASDAGANDNFGAGLAFSGDTMVVGAERHDGAAGADMGAAYVFVLDGGSWMEQAKLTSLDPAPSDWFGNFGGVAIDGDTAVIGAYMANGPAGGDQGKAFVFERIGPKWIGPDTRVLASDGALYDNFGTSVGLSGAAAIIGAPYDDHVVGSDQGSAYIFMRDGSQWIEQAKLTASDAGGGDLFGYSVSIDGDTAVVGAYLDNDKGTDSGSAYVFVREAGIWSEQAKLTASDGLAFDHFGYSVAVFGDTVIVGSLDDDDAGTNSGTAYVFVRSGSVWSQQAKLSASDASAGDRFGCSVGIDTNTAVVGAYGDFTDSGFNQGSAYVFTRSGPSWTQAAKLVASDGAANDSFGYSVAISGDVLAGDSTVLIGASNADDLAGSNQGLAYVFQQSGLTWAQQAKLFPPDASSSDNFGRAVSIEGDTALVGSFLDDDGGSASGSAYVFVRTGDVWSHLTKLIAPDADSTDYFGSAVSLSGDTALIGIWADDNVFVDDEQGAARFFDVPRDLFPLVFNLNQGHADSSFGAAFVRATTNDVLLASIASFHIETPIDPMATPVSMQSSGDIRLPYTSALTVSSGSMLLSDPMGSIRMFGEATVESGGLMVAGAQIEVAGDLSLLGGVLSATTLRNRSMIAGGGEVSANTINDDQFVVQTDLDHYGDYTNNGTTTIQNGTLTILGTLTDNGTIIGDFSGGARSGPGGFFVEADYSAGAESMLSLLAGVAKFGGDADIAIDSNTRFDMATSEVRMVGVSGTQTYERMSKDVGSSPDGLDRTLTGHYPLGTLRIGPTGTTVDLVDVHDNDGLGQGLCEAVYVSALIIDSGATLNTNGCPVYYETLTNNGGVDDPMNLIQISVCAADFSGDGQVNGADLAILLAAWSSANSPADLSGDGNVDGADLAILLASWGPC